MARGRIAHAAAVLGGYVIFFCALFSPVLVDGRILAPNDGLFLSYPAFHAREHLWNPWLFSGFPSVGDPSEMAWYPLARLLPTFNALVISAYVTASALAYALVFARTRSRAAAALGGLVFGTSGFFVGHLRHVNVIHAAAWLPLFFLALERLAAGAAGGRWIALLAAGTGLSTLAGHTQITFYGLAAAGVYALVLAPRAAGGWARFLGAAAAGVLLGVALAAILLAPLSELVRESIRPGLDFATFVSYSLPPQQLPMLLFPYLFGGMGAPYRGDPTLQELSGYVGLLPLALAAAGLALGARETRRERLFFAALALAAVLLALGAATPLASVFFHLPGFRMFRAPARHFAELALAVAVLAGEGLAALAAAEAPRRRRAVLALAAASPAILAAVVVFGVARPAAGFGGISLASAVATIVRGRAILVPLAALAAGLGALGVFAARPRRSSAALLAGVAALDLASFAWFGEWREAPIRPALFEEPAALEALVAPVRAAGQRIAPVVGLAEPRDGAPPNRSRLWRIPSTSGYHPLALGRYATLLSLDYSGELERGPDDALSPENRALDILAARYALVPRPVESPPDPARWRPAGEAGEVAVFENLRALPRAWLVSEVRTLPAEAILGAIRTSRLPDGSPFDPSRTALVEVGPARLEVERDPEARVALAGLGATEVDVEVASRVPAFLVLSDIDYPAWRAEIDGTPAAILRTDYILRGVAVPAGAHRVRFVFAPGLFYAGAAVSALAALALLALLARGLPRPGATGPAPAPPPPPGSAP
jgi:hypothetical protein